MESIWIMDSKKPKFESLKGDIKTDVLIIGGGLAGILCGYMLQNSGVDCVICEADEICFGITKNTTAKITYQHGLIYDKMIKKFGTDTARLYLRANQSALREYEKLCEDIDCDFKRCNSFVFSKTDKEKLKAEVVAINKIGGVAEFYDKTPLPFEVAGAVSVKHQAQFNPLKLAYAIAENLKVFENTEISELTEYGALSENGKIKAEKIIVATHFPFINKYGGYFLKMYQQRSYVIALKNAQNVNGMYIDEAENGLSFRNYKDLLLLGGGGHRTGKQGGNWRELREFANKYYPKAKEVCHFATQDCKTLDEIPYIGRYSKMTPNVFVATGFNKWGMTSSMASAMILRDMITGNENETAKIFSPSRSILHPQLAVNMLESAKNLLTPTTPRCPHLGCALKYNKAEHSWDCPCHGSRFSNKGELIDNPATKDIKTII